MKKIKTLLLVSALALVISAEAKFLGWETNWTYTYKEGNCIVQVAVQTHYIFWIESGTREKEIGRNCTNANHGTPPSGTLNPHT
jgi:hypothetical protein